MTNESAHFTPEAKQPDPERTGRIRNFLTRARGALGSLLGQSGVMVEGPARPVRMPNLTPQAEKHLFGSESDERGMGPLLAQDARMGYRDAMDKTMNAGKGGTEVVDPAALGVNSATPETGDIGASVKPNSTRDLQYPDPYPGAGDSMKDLLAGDMTNAPGPDAIGAPQVNPEQNLPVQNQGGTIRQ